MIIFSCWITSAIWMGLHFRPARSCIDISMDCCPYWAQCFAVFSRGLWNILTSIYQVLARPISTDTRQDRRILWAVVATETASRKEILVHVSPAVSPSTIGNRLLAAGLRSHVPQARLPLTPWHCQARLLWCRERNNWRVKWRSSVMRVGSVCMWVMDIHMYGIDLVSIIFESAFTHNTQALSQASWCGRPSVTAWGHIFCFCRVNKQCPLHCTGC